ncbi:hypothetical protein L5G32_12580 [Gordonia sp. HY002]|uniref:hypothetical protein n=1 Tax=Gordonia zhenghanii TaxID=2911516 RepID=UPI001EF12F53|nr:hypothetical protein [Gordonia zhenghanii]MCF8571104.1 hypothetical protein [Gordonia zhenghanii]MCF8604688.1 hypothetical protein [Gordonia zhenghanii]
MTVIGIVLLLIALFVVIGAGVFVFALARSSKSGSSKEGLSTSAAIPGVDVAVPASWARSHDAEARLHRRIRDAVAALDATIGMTSVGQIDDRAQLMVSARELDERLVTIWSLPAPSKTQPLAEADQGVAALESAASSVALESGDGAVGRAQDAAAGIGGQAAPPAVPPVPDVTPPQPAEPRDRKDPPSSLAE